MGTPARPVFRNPASSAADAPESKRMERLWAAAAAAQPFAAFLTVALALQAAWALSLFWLAVLPATRQVRPGCHPAPLCLGCQLWSLKTRAGILHKGCCLSTVPLQLRLPWMHQ